MKSILLNLVLFGTFSTFIYAESSGKDMIKNIRSGNIQKLKDASQADANVLNALKDYVVQLIDIEKIEHIFESKELIDTYQNERNNPNKPCFFSRLKHLTNQNPSLQKYEATILHENEKYKTKTFN